MQQLRVVKAAVSRSFRRVAGLRRPTHPHPTADKIAQDLQHDIDHTREQLIQRIEKLNNAPSK